MAKGKRSERQRPTDRSNYYRMLGVVYVMILFGLIMVLSASSVRAFASTGDSYYYIKRQLFSLFLGSIALIVLAKTPVKKLEQIAPQGIYVVIALLVAVLIPGIGKNAGGASRWIPIGGFHLQPSEFAKLAVVLYTAHFFAKQKGAIRDIKELIYPYGLMIAGVVLLVMKQPDMGTTIAICLAAFAMIFIGGLDMRYIASLGAMSAAVMVYFTYSASYRLERLTSFLRPSSDPLGSGWHITQSLLAFGSGGLRGVGLGLSRQKYFYLPAAHTDFIFAIVGEELGLLGTLFTVALFVFFAWTGVRIALQSKSLFGRLLAGGLTSMIILQALVNMGAVTAVLPITGIPMPFISYGGSSLIVNLAAIGVLISISLEHERRAATKRGHDERRTRNLRLVEVETKEERRSAPTTPGKRRSASATKKRTASQSKRKTTQKRREPQRTASTTSSSSSKSSTTKVREQPRRSKTDASNNQRRRNSGARVSRPGARQSSSKDNKRS